MSYNDRYSDRRSGSDTTSMVRHDDQQGRGGVGVDVFGRDVARPEPPPESPRPDQPHNSYHITDTRPAPKTKSAHYKTEMCKRWQSSPIHFCQYGAKCQFAHGPDELQVRGDRPQNHRTKPCWSFSVTGTCRCVTRACPGRRLWPLPRRPWAPFRCCCRCRR